MSKIHTHYDNLQVSRTASAEVITAAYKALCIRFHPDKNPGDAQAEKIMKIVNRSYAVLSDPSQRAMHDAWIKRQSAKRSGPGETSPERETPQASKADGAKAKASSGASPSRMRLVVGGGVLLLGALGIIETLASPTKEGTSASTPSPSSPKPSDPLAQVFGPDAQWHLDNASAPSPSLVEPSRSVARAPNGSNWPTAAAYVPGYDVRNADGLSTLTVDNTRNSSAMFVKLISADGSLARAFYIPGKGSFTLRRVTAGNYQIHYLDLSDGSYWGSQPFDVTEIREPDGTKFSNISITLFKVLNGNFDTHPLTASDF